MNVTCSDSSLTTGRNCWQFKCIIASRTTSIFIRKFSRKPRCPLGMITREVNFELQWAIFQNYNYNFSKH